MPAVNVPRIEVGTGNQVKVIQPVLLTAIGPSGAPIAIRVDASGTLAVDAPEAIPLDTTSTPPITSTSPGIKDQRIYRTGFIYECINTNTWIRYPVTTTF
jgi:hypothetical protein